MKTKDLIVLCIANRNALLTLDYKGPFSGRYSVLFISKPPDKNNIKMSVRKLSQEEELEITFSWLTEELKTRTNEMPKTIINCRSLNACGELYSMLDSVLDGDAMSNIAMFHSKTPDALKTKVLDNFVPMDGLLRVVVATTALGMGVNIPDVERVCHFGIPDTRNKMQT